MVFLLDYFIQCRVVLEEGTKDFNMIEYFIGDLLGWLLLGVVLVVIAFIAIGNESFRYVIISIIVLDVLGYIVNRKKY